MDTSKLRYSKDHEWVSEAGLLGVTDHAQSELGDVVFVELPKNGKEIKALSEIGVLESVKAVSNVYSPVSGTVVEINQELSSSPDLINKDPYGKGWIARIKMSDPSELNGLMSEEEYSKFIGR